MQLSWKNLSNLWMICVEMMDTPHCRLGSPAVEGMAGWAVEGYSEHPQCSGSAPHWRRSRLHPAGSTHPAKRKRQAIIQKPPSESHHQNLCDSHSGPHIAVLSIVGCGVFTLWQHLRSYQDRYQLATVHTHGNQCCPTDILISHPVTLSWHWATQSDVPYPNNAERQPSKQHA